MTDIITIDGVKYKRVVEEVKQPTAKYKVGDWVRVIANKASRPDSDRYIGNIAKITNVYDLGYYKRKVNDEFVYAYGIGEFYVVYEDELELSEKPKESPFDIKVGEKYYTIFGNGKVDSYSLRNDTLDKELFDVANACKDIALMEQRALHEMLDRLLWRASIEAGESDNPWDYSNPHYYIYYNIGTGKFAIDYCIPCSIQGVCYFPTEEAAQDAIDNIVRPFMAEHPDFVW